MAYSGAGGGRWDGRLPYGDDATSITTFDSISHHHPPLSVGVTLGFSLNDRWQLTAGLSYQRLTSEMLSGNSLVSLHERQLVRQLGVPVGASWRVAVGGRWQVYASASATLLLPLRSWLSSHYVVADGSSAEPAERRLHMGMQWAVGVGLGLSYEVAPHASFFVEPSVQHYFRGGDNVSTWNTGHPLVLSLPIGLRIGF